MRTRSWLCAGLLAVVAGCQAGARMPPATPGLEPQAEDYAKARSQFKTNLVRKGPALQAYRNAPPPKDVTPIDFPSGTLRLKAWLHRPNDDTRHPAVLFLHGGFAFGADDWEQTQPYRDAGFVTLTPMLRGENGQLGFYTMFYDEVDDVLAAADYLSKVAWEDPNRLYVAGHSVGGTLTMLAALASPRFRAAASFSGSPDQISFTRGQEKLAPFDLKNVREFQMRSPVAYAASFKCPVRLYYGSQESFFAPPSQRTAVLAKEKGLDVEAVSVPGDHHSSVAPAMKQSIEFFKQK
jgi:dipeptidyl aminopeptidase/acylaminoacyl peptidase